MRTPPRRSQPARLTLKALDATIREAVIVAVENRTHTLWDCVSQHEVRLDAMQARTLWGRLRWLLTGR